VSETPLGKTGQKCTFKYSSESEFHEESDSAIYFD
jgi:hypothetical protein